MKGNKLQIQEAHTTVIKIKQTKYQTPRHIMIKLLKTKDKRNSQNSEDSQRKK